MSLTAIKSALEIAVEAMDPGFPTARGNDKFEPVKGTPWQRVTVLGGTPVNQTTDDSFRENGILRISLFYPLKEGTGRAYDRVDLIRQAFPRTAKFTRNGFTVVLRGSPVKISETRETDWVSVVVDVRFYSDID